MPSPPSVASYLSPQPTVRPRVPSGDLAGTAGVSVVVGRVGHPADAGVGGHAEVDLGAGCDKAAEPASGRDVVEPELVEREVVVGRRRPDHRPDDRDRVGELPHSRAGHRVERLVALRDTGGFVVARPDLPRTFARVPGDVRELQRPRGFGVDDVDFARRHQQLQVGVGDRFGAGRHGVRGGGLRARCRSRWWRSP